MNTNDSVNKKSTNYFLIGVGILICILIIITIIFFIITAIKCNDKCNTNGDCSLLTGKCNCKKGYKGDRCKDETKDETKDKCSDKCNYSGICNQTTGECKCDDGYYGVRCDSLCDDGKFGEYCTLSCFNGGKYNTTTKKCDCINGYLGKYCEHSCFNGGKYNTETNKCDCATNYFGTYCSVVCLNGGKYNTTTNKCDCINGYFGKKCEESCRNGKYNEITQKCDCTAGYGGSTCTENKCAIHNYCNKSGTCDIITGKCICNKNFSGEFCDKFTPKEEVYVIIKEGGFGLTNNCRETSDMENIYKKYNATSAKNWNLTKAYEDGSQILLPSYESSTNPPTGELWYSLIMQQDNCLNIKYVNQSYDAIKNTGIEFNIKKGVVSSESLTWSSNKIKVVNIDKQNIFGLLLYGIKPAKNEMNVWDNLNEPPPFKNGFCILNWYTSCDGKTPNRYSQNYS